MDTHHTDSSTYGDICCFDVSHFGTQEHSEVYVYGRDDDMIKDMERKEKERNNSIPFREMTQPFTYDFEEECGILGRRRMLILDQQLADINMLATPEHHLHSIL
jgi:hypothetical protein